MHARGAWNKVIKKQESLCGQDYKEAREKVINEVSASTCAAPGAVGAGGLSRAAVDVIVIEDARWFYSAPVWQTVALLNDPSDSGTFERSVRHTVSISDTLHSRLF